MIKRWILVLLLSGLMGFTAIDAQAGKYDIKEMTPAVQKALESRRDRFDELEALKAKGVVGENNRGYVEAIDGDENVAEIIKAENIDRKAIYQTIVDQNNLSDAIATVEKTFAEVQRNKAESGEKVQNEDGSWITK